MQRSDELYRPLGQCRFGISREILARASGDYYAGPNHVLPTSGTARFFSPLSVDSFIKKSSFICYNRAALEAARDDILSIARAEGLDAHAHAVAVRFEREQA